MTVSRFGNTMITQQTSLMTLVFISILIYYTGSKNVRPSYSVKTKSVECNVNPLWSTNYSCKLIPINWEKSTLTVIIYLAKPVTKAMVRVELFKYTNQFRPFLVNVTANVCKWLDTQKRTNSYTGIFFSMMTKFTTVNHSCPFTDMIKGEGIYFDPELVEFGFPPGKFMFAFTVFESYPYVFMGSIKIVGVVKYGTNNGPPKQRDGQHFTTNPRYDKLMMTT